MPREQNVVQNWFTSENTHDMGAVYTSMLNAIPFFSDFKNHTNRLVNFDQKVATDRGSSAVILNATQFSGPGIVKIDVI